MSELLSSLVYTLTEVIISIMVGLFALLGLPAQPPTHPPFHEINRPSVLSLIERGGPSSSSATSSSVSPRESDAGASPEPKTTEMPSDPSPEPEQRTESTPEPSAETHSPLSDAELNETARAALVNIFCTNTGASSLSATGSGVVIDPRGVILTNTHLAQYLLLEKDPALVNCHIRTGEPAQITHDAELLYVSPLWIQENAAAITEREPLGTGEYDFALLRITDTVDKTAEQNTFPYVLPDSEMSTIQKGDEVFLAGYPAGFLGGQAIIRDLYPSSAMTTITELFTFGTQTIDVISLAGSILAQQGSSGAGVLSAQTGNLIGIVVTSSIEGSTDERTLNAITLAHINRGFVEDLGISLQAYLNADLKTRADGFQDTVAPALRELLLQEIE